MENLREKLKKIEALARSGIAGERASAQRLLEQLSQKYGVPLEQIVAQEKDFHWFPVVGREQQDLFCQVLIHVLQTRQIAHKKKPSGLWCELTAAEALDVAEAWAHYRAAWKKQREDFFLAFIHKNGLYGPPDASPGEASGEAKAQALRIFELMKGMRADRWDNKLKLTGS